MVQLESRFYSRAEIAEVIKSYINENHKNDKEYVERTVESILNDTKHFKRNTSDTLSKWGYGFDWMPHGIMITHVPDTKEARLKEILLRQFHVDIQVDMYAFACFVTAFTDVPGFSSMPWKLREKEFENYSGVFFTSRTLSSWCKKLIEREIMSKSETGTYWKTYFRNGEKRREITTKEEALNYFKRRAELLNELVEEVLQEDPSLSQEAARSIAWKDVYGYLWAEFGYCCYFCKTFRFFAWNEQGWLAEVFELTREISRKEEKIK